MKKIVELRINKDEFESETLGVDVISLVEAPAIGYEWMAFAEQHAFVEPKPGEDEGEFISRCIPVVTEEGYDSDQAAAICYSYWEGKMSEDEIESIQDRILMAAEELGEEHDPKNTVYLSQEAFDADTVAGVADAVKALGLLGKRDADEELKTVYKYEGPAPQRKFCRAMIGLSRIKVFTKPDIDEMTRRGVNSEFNSPIRSGNYDIFKYAGGSNCRHAWNEYKMFNRDGKTLLIKTGNSGTPPSDLPLNGYVNEEQKKKSEIAYAISQNFATVDEDQKIVVAPAMVPNTLIRRLDENNDEYYVYFAQDTIKKIAEKFFRNSYQNNTNINHNGDITNNNTLLESWIVEDPQKDKSQIYGFEVPQGTWMVSMRINDDDTWQKIKSGELKGYSIEGSFLELQK
jgi:hypothetical protein